MKRALAVFLALLLGAASLAAAEEEDAEYSDFQGYFDEFYHYDEVMTPQALQERIDRSPYLNLLDLRSREAYDRGHIPSASSYPLAGLEDDMVDILNSGFTYMSVEIIVYGDTEEEGEAGLDVLRDLGFYNLYRLESIDVWDGKLMTAEDELRLMSNLDTTDIYGNEIDDSLLQGYQLNMINVWATYCAPCLSEMEDLGRLAQDVKDMGVQVVGLLSDAEDATLTPVQARIDLAKEIVAATKADYTHLVPSRDLYWKVLGQVSAVPTTFFVDETGMLVGYAYVGAKDYDAWMNIIQELLAQMP